MLRAGNLAAVGEGAGRSRAEAVGGVCVGTETFAEPGLWLQHSAGL